MFSKFIGSLLLAAIGSSVCASPVELNGVASQRPEINLTASDQVDDKLGMKRSVKAGFVSTFTQKFFTDYNALLIDFMMGQMRTMELEDFCNTQVVGIFLTYEMCTLNQKLKHFSINTENSHLQIVEDQASLSLLVSGINLEFDFDFKISSDPEWFAD